jgi:glutamyl-tRNA synthetase
MILGSDGAKLSKRHGAVSVLQYRDEGFLPEALLNYLARLGWSHGDQEIFSIADMIGLFDIADVNKSPSAFNGEKLSWLNQQHMMRAAPERLIEPLRQELALAGVVAEDDSRLRQIALILRERVKTLKEMATASLFFFRAPASFDEKAVRKHVTPEILALLAQLTMELEGLTAWTTADIHGLISGFAAARDLPLGKLAQPIRLAMCGTTVSPPIDSTLAILGKPEVLARLARARAVWSV